MRTIRQAIPLEEIIANMKNEPSSCSKTRYSRKSTFISESEADARAVIGVLIASTIAVISICSALWVVWHSIGSAQAQSAPICALSEMKEQAKQLNVLHAPSERIKR